MLILRKLTKDTEGNINATFSLNSEQAAILISYAVNALVGVGLASIEDMEEYDLNNIPEDNPQ